MRYINPRFTYLLTYRTHRLAGIERCFFRPNLFSATVLTKKSLELLGEINSGGPQFSSYAYKNVG